MPPPQAALAAPREAMRWASGPAPEPDGRQPAEFTHSLLAARRGGGPFFAGPAGEPSAGAAAAMLDAQATLGNHAVAAARQASPAPVPAAPAGAAAARPALDGADPVAPAAALDATAQPPPAADPQAPAKPAGKGGGARASAKGGGAVARLSATTAEAVQQQAMAVAQAIPQPPAPAPGSAAAPSQRRPASRRQIQQQLAGPAPVPMATPAYAAVEDPIPDATRQIETAANAMLPEQALPPVDSSPGGHMPDLVATPLTAAQRRMVLLGEQAMIDAQINPEEKEALKTIRETILAPPSEDAAPAGPPPPPMIRVTSDPPPPADLTLAERDMFTAVLARLLADPARQAREILDTARTDLPGYPGQVLVQNAEFPELSKLGEEQLPTIESHLTAAARPLAQLLGVAGQTLDTALAARREALTQTRKEGAEAAQASADQAVAVAAANAGTHAAEVHAATAVAKDAEQRAQAARHVPKPGFRALAEAAVARIQDKVSEGIARIQFQEHERQTALDKAHARQIAAYETAATADELSATQANAANAGSTNADTARVARNQASVAIAAAKKWAAERIKALKPFVDALKADAKVQADKMVASVQDQGAAAFRALHAWGDAQDGAAESWWQDNARSLDQWASAAHDTATTWASAQAHLARLELQRDLQRVRENINARMAADEEHGTEYQAFTEEKRHDFVEAVIGDPAQQDSVLGGLAAGFAARLAETEREPLKPMIDAALIALPPTSWAAIQYVAKASNPGFSAAEKSGEIYKAGAGKWGTDKDIIFANLKGLQPFELAAVKAHYEFTHQTSLSDAMDSEFSGDQKRRALLLLEGKGGEAAAEAIHDAVYGPGANKAQIMEALRGLTDEERAAAIKYYHDKYEESLSDRLDEDLSDSQAAQAQALLKGKTAEADAFALDHVFRGGWGEADGADAAKVYDQVRAEVMVNAQREGWTSAEAEAEVLRRNQEIEGAFNEKLGSVRQYGYSSKHSAFENAVTYSLHTPRERTLVKLLAANDLAGADAARMEIERQGFYADDAVLKGVIQTQMDRAMQATRLDRGPQLAAGTSRQIREEMKRDRDAGRPWTEEKRHDRQAELEKRNNDSMQDEAFDRARHSSVVLDSALKHDYGTSLSTLLADNMSGGDKREAEAKLKLIGTVATSGRDRSDRRIDWAYTRIRYSIEGAGTDMTQLKAGLNGLNKDEIAQINDRWKYDHGGETLEDAVRGDTSGREEGDLVYIVQNGAAETVQAKIDALKEKKKRDEDDSTFIGRWTSGDERQRTAEDLAALEKMLPDLRNPNLPESRRVHIGAAFNQRVEDAGHSIEAQRAAIDQFTDKVTTVFQYYVGACAVVAAVLVGIVSGGTAVPALIAIAGSLIGTLGSMAIKGAIKGGAYGTEEIATDLAIGAVDVVVQAITAGAFKGGGFLKGLTTQLKHIGQASFKLALGQGASRAAAMSVGDVVKGQAERKAGSMLGSAARGVGKFATGQVEQLALSLPTALAGQLLDERNMREGNPLTNVGTGMLHASLENLKMGVAMGAMGHAVGAGLTHGLTLVHPPRTPVEARLYAYERWQTENPGQPRDAYVREMEASQASEAHDQAAAHAATREARAALLDTIPASQRAGMLDVPIVHLSEAQFKALAAGRGADAFVHTYDGQAAVVVREGAPPSAVRELGPRLLETVAPGTAGRTVSPNDSLPPHLRNRVTFEPTTNPKFAADGVSAKPVFNDKGHVIGITVEIGPRARAIDIQKHVGTIEAMHKYSGLLGEARVAVNKAANRLGIDTNSPLVRGRWEASLEVAKLPAIIEERILRLSKEPLAPHEEAAVMQQVENLQRQLESEKARLALGAEAEARGYVAADSGMEEPTAKPKETAAVDEPAAKPVAPEAVVPAKKVLTPEERKAQRAVLEVLYDNITLLDERHRALVKKQKVLEAVLDAPIESVKTRIAEHLEGLAEKPGPKRKTAFDKIQDLFENDKVPEAMEALREWVKDKPRVDEKGNPHSIVVDTLNDLRQYDAARAYYEAHEPEVARQLDPLKEELEANKAELKAKLASGDYSRMAFGVAIHDLLPDPTAGLDFVPTARTAVADKSHKDGYRSELKLACEIADINKQEVIEYADAVGTNGADVVAVDKTTGYPTLYDAKYRSSGSMSWHSETFTDQSINGTLRKAAARAVEALNEKEHHLPQSIRDIAIKHLEDGNFHAITAHTRGNGFKETVMIVRKFKGP